MTAVANAIAPVPLSAPHPARLRGEGGASPAARSPPALIQEHMVFVLCSRKRAGAKNLGMVTVKEVEAAGER